MKFTSKYIQEGKPITGAQHLAELMVERQARILLKTTLPVKFASNPKFAKEFVKQVVIANRLLKLFSVQAILAALKTKQGQKVYSLGAAYLKPIIQKTQDTINKTELESVALDTSLLAKPGVSPPVLPTLGPKSVAARLKGL